MEKNIVTAIIMATMLEAKPFVQSVSLNLKQDRKAPFLLFQSDNIILIISGIGKSNAATATAYGCLKFKPACICNLGAAGATQTHHHMGEIFHIHKIIEYDRPDLKSKKPHIHKPDKLDGFQSAKLATSDRPILSPDERKAISLKADLIDMEGASIAQACRTFKTKCFLFKFVSDTPEHTRDEDIVSNIRVYRSRFYEFFEAAVMPILA